MTELTSQGIMVDIVSGWRNKFTPEEITMLMEQIKGLIELSKSEIDNDFRQSLVRMDARLSILKAAVIRRPNETEYIVSCLDSVWKAIPDNLATYRNIQHPEWRE